MLGVRARTLANAIVGASYTYVCIEYRGWGRIKRAEGPTAATALMNYSGRAAESRGPMIVVHTLAVLRFTASLLYEARRLTSLGLYTVITLLSSFHHRNHRQGQPALALDFEKLLVEHDATCVTPECKLHRGVRNCTIGLKMEHALWKGRCPLLGPFNEKCKNKCLCILSGINWYSFVGRMGPELWSWSSLNALWIIVYRFWNDILGLCIGWRTRLLSP